MEQLKFIWKKKTAYLVVMLFVSRHPGFHTDENDTGRPHRANTLSQRALNDPEIVALHR